MEEIATLTKTLLIDRGKRKIRFSVINKNNMMGCIIPYDR